MPFTKMNNNFLHEVKEREEQPIVNIFAQKQSTKNIINLK